MSGIICCACSISPISVPEFALTQWRIDLNKIQEENESQQNRDRWWILLPGRRRTTDLFEASDHHYHEQFMESFSSVSYSKWDDDRAWSSHEWKPEIKTYDRSGRPDKTSSRMLRKVRLGHKEILLDGTAQSVRNEETLRDRSGRLCDINSQEEADFNNSSLETMIQNWNCL